VKLGDLSYINPATGNRFDPDQLLTNWPQFFGDFPQHLGWGIGLLCGVAVYFVLTGKFRNDSMLFVYLSVGWLVAFLAMPVLGGVPETLAHYQSANWHSILEQMHGFGYGLAIAIAMAMLWRRKSVDPREARVGGWTVGFSVWFAWFAVGCLNLHKLVETWVANGSVPPTLKAPLLGFIEASPLVWFNIVWWTAATVAGLMLVAHRRQPLDIVPATWTGKGQLIYIVFLWLVVVGNLNRTIPGFSNGRMVTEWVLFMNASLATLLIALLPAKQLRAWSMEQKSRCTSDTRHPTPDTKPLTPDTRHLTPNVTWPSLTNTWLCGLSAATILICLYGYLTLAIYQPHLEGKPWANHRRFGPEAKWRIDPILKHGEHP
jgi:hypothetical protein